jgi:hypothetical protein
MRRLAACIFGVALFAAVFVACRQYLPSNRYLQVRTGQGTARSTADARGKFDHDRHARVLRTSEVTCLDCHRFDALIETADEERAPDLSAQALHPGSTPCHFCHTGEQTRLSAAPQACTTCHENILPLRPADHDLAWMKVHANMARVNSARCETCHRQAECMDCHARRDSIQTRMHDRNFRFFHGIQARANPMQCSSCHREDFCTQCHARN